jgi:ribosomal protein S18 acetylase RimI-like enzyme
MMKQTAHVAIHAVRDGDVDDATAVAMLKKAWNEEYFGAEDAVPPDVLMSVEQASRRLRAQKSAEETFLAERDGRPVGFLCVRFSPYLDEDVPYAEVTQLYVLPNERRRGVVTVLMARAEEIAHGRACTSVHLVTRSNNHDAVAFYRSLGYEDRHVGFEKFLPGSHHLKRPAQ